MRSAAVILTQHRRPRRLMVDRLAHALPRRIGQPRRHARWDGVNHPGIDNETRACRRQRVGHTRAVRPRHRPDALVPRGFLPLVVH
jgi:hypothetical protein